MTIRSILATSICMPNETSHGLSVVNSHLLLNGFMRTCHYGFLSNPIRKKRLPLLREKLSELTGRKIKTKEKKSKDTIHEVFERPQCQVGLMSLIIPILSVKVKRRCWS